MDDTSMPHDVSTQDVSVPLIDGAVVRLRRLGPGDFDAVVSLADDMSNGERYLRFFTEHPSYVDEWATSLTEPDPDVVALGAYEGEHLIGIGNYVVSSAPGFAEIAIAVAHRQHDRGVGTALLAELGHVAWHHEIRHFTADVLVQNISMRRIMAESPWHFTQHRDGSVLSVNFDLDEPDTPARQHDNE